MKTLFHSSVSSSKHLCSLCQLEQEQLGRAKRKLPRGLLHQTTRFNQKGQTLPFPRRNSRDSPQQRVFRLAWPKQHRLWKHFSTLLVGQFFGNPWKRGGLCQCAARGGLWQRHHTQQDREAHVWPFLCLPRADDTELATTKTAYSLRWVQYPHREGRWAVGS